MTLSFGAVIGCQDQHWCVFLFVGSEQQDARRVAVLVYLALNGCKVNRFAVGIW